MADLAALVLAAGRASRYRAAGGAEPTKLIADYRGEPLVRWAVRAALASRARPVVVVTGHARAEVEAALAGLDLGFAHNPDFAEGLATSLRAGVAALPADVAGALVLLGDMPEASAAVADALIDAFAATPGALAAVALYAGRRGNPVLLGRGLFAEVARLTGDEGARGLIAALPPGRIASVEVAEAGVTKDVDRPEDLRSPVLRGRQASARGLYGAATNLPRNLMSDLNKNYIAGEWVEGVAVTRNVSPSNTDDVVGEFAQASAAQVDEAVKAARAALHGWARSTPQERHDVLLKVSLEIAARRDELGRLLAREEGKTLPEAIGEVGRAGQIFDFFAGEALRIPGEKFASVRPGVDIEVTREPVGVVGIISPWNFPIAIPAWKIAPALCYGNTVVFKPADLVPGSAHALAEILVRAGLPKGVFNLVMGRGATVGQAMLDHPRIDAISFTGSVATGQRVAAACAKHMRKFQLEMGGKNPLIVLDDADMKLAVECALNGAFFATGQRCTASSRLVVTEGIYNRFADALAERMAGLVVDNAVNAGAHIGPVVDQSQLDQDLKYVDIGVKEGAKLKLGGERLNRSTPGFYMAPALFVDASNEMRISREEIFGPVASMIPAKSYEHALQIANDTEFGLVAGICTSSLKHASHFKRNAEAGMTMVNLPTAGVDYHAPFGGRKGSSYGAREQGRYAAEFYTTVKTAYTFA